jgi:hypothetical protein
MRRINLFLSLAALTLSGFLGTSFSSLPVKETPKAAAESTSTLVTANKNNVALVDGDYYLIGFPYDTNTAGDSRYRYYFFNSSTVSGSSTFVWTTQASSDSSSIYSYYLRSTLSSAIFRASSSDGGTSFTFYSMSSFLALNYNSASTDTAKPISYSNTGTAFKPTIGDGASTRYTYFGDGTTNWTIAAKSGALDSPTIVFGTDSTTYEVNQNIMSIFHLDSTYVENNTAYGLANKLTNSTITTKADALAAYQALPSLQRYVLSHTLTIEGTTMNATMANAVGTGKTTYETLCNDSTLTTQTYYQAATPSISVDYKLDRFIGFDPSENYMMKVGTTTYGPLLITMYYDGSWGMKVDNSKTPATDYPYNAYGQTVSWSISSAFDTTYDSPSQSLVVLAKNPADLTSIAATVALKKIATGPSTTIDGVYNNEIILADNPTLEYMLIDKGTATENAFLSDVDKIASWNQTGDLTSLTVYEENTNANIILASENYIVYFRLKATDQYAASDYFATPFAVTTLSYDAGQSAHALVKSYAIYQEEIAKAKTASYTTTKHIQSIFDYVLANPSASYATDNYSTLTKYYDAAFQLDGVITSLDQAHKSSDSADSDSAYENAYTTLDSVDIISFVDYAGDTTSWTNTVTTFTMVAQFNRYKEGKEKDLIAYFNNSILPYMSTFTSENREKLWTELQTQLTTIRTIPGEMLTDDLIGTIDTALTTAETSLSTMLKTLQSGVAA